MASFNGRYHHHKQRATDSWPPLYGAAVGQKCFDKYSKFLSMNVIKPRRIHKQDVVNLTVPDIMSIQRPRSKESKNRNRVTKLKTQPLGFAQPTNASKLKCVLRAAPMPNIPPACLQTKVPITPPACLQMKVPITPPTKTSTLPDQHGLTDEIKNERILLLKNLATLLVDRIEAACTGSQKEVHPATNATQSPAVAYNPNFVSYGASNGVELKREGSHTKDVNAVLLGSNAALATHDASDDRQYPITTREMRSPPFRTGSSIVHPEKAKFLFPSAAQNIKEKNIDAHNEIRSHSHQDDLNFSPPRKESSRFVVRKAHHNNVKTEEPNTMFVGGRMQLSPGEKTSPPREKSIPKSRPTSRGMNINTTNSGAGNTRLLSLKKVNVGFEGEPTLPSVSPQNFTHFSPSDTKKNLGSRSHAMPQVAKVVSAGSSKSCNNANNASQSQAHITSIESVTIKKKEARLKTGELIFEELWSNIICDVFDDIFRVCKETHHLNSWNNDRYVESPTKIRSPFQAQQVLTIRGDIDDPHYDLRTGKYTHNSCFEITYMIYSKGCMTIERTFILSISIEESNGMF